MASGHPHSEIRRQTHEDVLRQARITHNSSMIHHINTYYVPRKTSMARLQFENNFMHLPVGEPEPEQQQPPSPQQPPLQQRPQQYHPESPGPRSDELPISKAPVTGPNSPAGPVSSPDPQPLFHRGHPYVSGRSAMSATSDNMMPLPAPAQAVPAITDAALAPNTEECPTVAPSGPSVPTGASPQIHRRGTCFQGPMLEVPAYNDDDGDGDEQDEPDNFFRTGESPSPSVSGWAQQQQQLQHRHQQRQQHPRVPQALYDPATGGVHNVCGADATDSAAAQRRRQRRKSTTDAPVPTPAVLLCASRRQGSVTTGNSGEELPAGLVAVPPASSTQFPAYGSKPRMSTHNGVISAGAGVATCPDSPVGLARIGARDTWHGMTAAATIGTSSRPDSCSSRGGRFSRCSLPASPPWLSDGQAASPGPRSGDRLLRTPPPGCALGPTSAPPASGARVPSPTGDVSDAGSEKGSPCVLRSPGSFQSLQGLSLDQQLQQQWQQLQMLQNQRQAPCPSQQPHPPIEPPRNGLGITSPRARTGAGELDALPPPFSQQTDRRTVKGGATPPPNRAGSSNTEPSAGPESCSSTLSAYSTTSAASATTGASFCTNAFSASAGADSADGSPFVSPIGLSGKRRSTEDGGNGIANGSSCCLLAVGSSASSTASHVTAACSSLTSPTDPAAALSLFSRVAHTQIRQPGPQEWTVEPSSAAAMVKPDHQGAAGGSGSGSASSRNSAAGPPAFGRGYSFGLYSSIHVRVPAHGATATGAAFTATGSASGKASPSPEGESGGGAGGGEGVVGIVRSVFIAPHLDVIREDGNSAEAARDQDGPEPSQPGSPVPSKTRAVGGVQALLRADLGTAATAAASADEPPAAATLRPTPRGPLPALAVPANSHLICSALSGNSSSNSGAPSPALPSPHRPRRSSVGYGDEGQPPLSPTACIPSRSPPRRTHGPCLSCSTVTPSPVATPPPLTSPLAAASPRRMSHEGRTPPLCAPWVDQPAGSGACDSAAKAVLPGHAPPQAQRESRRLRPPPSFVIGTAGMGSCGGTPTSPWGPSRPSASAQLLANGPATAPAPVTPAVHHHHQAAQEPPGGPPVAPLNPKERDSIWSRMEKALMSLRDK